MSTTDLVLLTPNLSPSCPKCSLQCISQTTQALSFLKKQTWQCEGKKFLALIPYLFKCSSSVHCHEWDRNGWKMKTIQARLSSWLDDSCQQSGVRHPLVGKPSADSKPNEYRWTAKTNTRFLYNPSTGIFQSWMAARNKTCSPLCCIIITNFSLVILCFKF